MNDQNLIPTTQRSESEVRAMTRKGGIASGRSRRIKSRGRQLLLDLLAGKETDPKIVEALTAEGIDPRDLTREVAMHLRQVDKAIRKADTFAYKTILQAAGVLTNEVNIGSTEGGAVQITVGSAEVQDALGKVLAAGAAPRKPETPQDDNKQDA